MRAGASRATRVAATSRRSGRHDGRCRGVRVRAAGRAAGSRQALAGQRYGRCFGGERVARTEPVTVGVAIVLLVAPIGWAALVFAFPIWVLVLSFMLWARLGTTESAPGF